jgi:hypothetical protein
MALMDIQRDAIRFDKRNEAFAQTQEVLMRVAKYLQPIRDVQMEGNHQQLIIELQQQIRDLQTKQSLPPQCDHTLLEQQMQTLTDEQDEARRRPVAPGMDEELRQERADMTQDKYQSGEEAHSLRTQLANALTLADPQAMEDRGQRFPGSTDFSGSDRTQLRRWITQLRMVP